MIQRQLDWEHARVRNEPMGWLVTDGSAVRTGDSDRTSLIASHRHVAFTGHDQGRAAAGGTAGRSRWIVRIEDGAGIGGVTASREAKALANRLPNNLSARIQNARDDGRVNVRYIAFQHVGTVHHRDAGDAGVVLDGNPLARQWSGLCTLNRTLPVPGIEPIFGGGWPISRAPLILYGQRRLRELIEAAIRGKHAVHEIAEGSQIVLAEHQIVRFGDSIQFSQGRLAQDPWRRRSRRRRLNKRFKLAGSSGAASSHDGRRHSARTSAYELAT